MAAPKKVGMEELCRKIVEVSKVKEWKCKIACGELEKVIGKLAELLEGEEYFKKYSARWQAIKLLEEDPQMTKEVGEAPWGYPCPRELERVRKAFEEKYGGFEVALIEAWYYIVKADS